MSTIPPEGLRAAPAPAAPAVVDRGWIRRNLGWPLSDEEPISSRSISPTGGVMGSVHRVRCAERSFVLKGPPSQTTAWGQFAAQAKVMEREAQLYRYLAAQGPYMEKVAPTCYWSSTSADGGALALEDLGACGATAATMARGLDHDEARAAVRCLAELHAGSVRLHCDPLDPPYPWLYTAASPGLVEAIELGLADFVRTTTLHPPGTDVRWVLDLDVTALLLDAHRGARLAALCHGDAWAGNVVFDRRSDTPGAPTALLIDWQFAMWGDPLSDVALLLLSSLQPQDRRAWQDELLGSYHELLVARTGIDYPAATCGADLARAQPLAAVVGLATVETYVMGMTGAELAGFTTRVQAALDCVRAAAG